MKAVLPGIFPERAFSTDYARKDLSYALALGSALGLDLRGATTADHLLRQASEAGYGDLYWPVVSRILDREPDEGGRGA
jgi:3-hydroxyisobutyrate dehydrogenase-like beta-hydroxyacid dehydrogenase